MGWFRILKVRAGTSLARCKASLTAPAVNLGLHTVCASSTVQASSAPSKIRANPCLVLVHQSSACLLGISLPLAKPSSYTSSPASSCLRKTLRQYLSCHLFHGTFHVSFT